MSKNFQNFSMANQSNKWLKIMFCLISVVALVRRKIWLVHLKALEMRMRKLVLDLSLAQILPEKINKMLSLNYLGFIDVLSTVHTYVMHRIFYFERYCISEYDELKACTNQYKYKQVLTSQQSKNHSTNVIAQWN